MTYLILFLTYSPIPNNRGGLKVLIKGGGGPTDNLNIVNLSTVFLVEITKIDKIENTTLPYKTALSEAIFKTIECGVQNSPITKNEVYSFIFLKILFQFKNLV